MERVEAPDEAAPKKKSVRLTEFFWLCDRCASEMTLQSDGKGKVVVKPAVPDLRKAS